MRTESFDNSVGRIDSDTIQSNINKGFSKAFVSLEFAKIRDMLCDCTDVPGAKEILSAITPSVSYENVLYMQKQTSEARKISETKGAPSFSGVRDISLSLERSEKGASLNMSELLNIAGVLRATRSVSEYFSTYKGSDELALNDYVMQLLPNKFLEDMITSSILSEDQIADNASPELYDIRRKIRTASNRIRETLQKYVSGGGSKFLQENIITTRNGRFVIPVKSEYRNEIKGLVHDTSSSGSTLFVEPMAVVDTNNEIRVLQSAEQAEIDKILYKISSECSRFSGNLKSNYKNLCSLAAIFAKAELSFRLDAVEPVISKKKTIDLKKARHPLLDKEKVVPIDVYLGKKFSLLVITGPNTGGKTVTLKTLGLFSLMAQCGLHIPAADGSTLPIFDTVLADIGDEQSIEQSLSTFSAHMVNIVDILKSVTPDSLVLFDELGAGTDPLEGAALAESILESIKNKGCLCAATTHYAELKAYALSTDGVSNASCEFDVETLRPTYRLMIGLPGRSNAFAIASRLGIPQEIISTAKDNMAGEALRFETLVDQLETQKSYYENEKKKAAKLREELSEMHKKTREERERFNKRLEAENERAQKQVHAIVEQARASADYIFNELDRIKKQKERDDFAANLAKSKQDIRAKLNDASKKSGYEPAGLDDDYVLPRPLKKGDAIILRDLNKKGTVLSVDGDNVTVQAGIIKTKTKTDNIMLDSDSTDKTKVIKSSKAATSVMSVKSEIDVRGMIGDDAWFVVDKYLDEAVVANLNQVTIIHGKGTGALRVALNGFLKRDKRVKSIRAGMFGEGDSGVTVVTLK